MKRSPSRIAQPCALAAQRLAQQKPRRALQRKRRGMELVELHVRRRRAGAIRHGDAVAGRHRRVGRVAVDLARAAARHQHRPRAARRNMLPVAIEQPAPVTTLVFDDTGPRWSCTPSA